MSKASLSDKYYEDRELVRRASESRREPHEALLSGSMARSYLKKAFSPGIGVESLSQVLDILEYASGLILGLALISYRTKILILR
jgi:tryptophan synthase alpha subunit